jgi:hypothetical protein
MYVVFKNQMVHRRKHLAERVGNLCHGRYLPVEMPAEDNYADGKCPGLPMEKDHHIDSLVGESESGTVEPDVFCRVNKLLETRDGKCELVEEFKLKLLEARSGNPTDKCIQIGASTMEPEIVKVRKCDGWNDRCMRELPP